MNAFISRFVSAAMLATLIAVSSAAAQKSVVLLDYSATPPASWVAVTPSSSKRLAQYKIPAADGTTGAEAVVYFFGKGQGGDVNANLARWKRQFSTPDSTHVYESIVRETDGAFPLTIAEYRGTYARGIGAGDGAKAKTGQALIAAIAETPRGTLFFQLFGNAAQTTAQRNALIAFVKSMK